LEREKEDKNEDKVKIEPKFLIEFHSCNQLWVGGAQPNIFKNLSVDLSAFRLDEFVEAFARNHSNRKILFI
jgi:hypothetical protein